MSSLDRPSDLAEVPMTANPIVSIINAIEAAMNEDMESLPLLSSAVNIDALCNLIEANEGESTEVSFDYEGHRVTVTKETVTVQA